MSTNSGTETIIDAIEEEFVPDIDAISVDRGENKYAVERNGMRVTGEYTEGEDNYEIKV